MKSNLATFARISLGSLLLAGCSSLSTPLPLREGSGETPVSSTVFVGRASASRFVEGTWERVPEYDYDFLVLERHFPGRWEATKEIHRRHPKYDGRAGPRDQTLFFSIRTTPAPGGGLDLVVESTLGSGKGHTDGSGLVLELAASETGPFVPFDAIRIAQDRRTPEGGLHESVLLFSRRDGSEVPFLRMDEEGVEYLPAKGIE